MQPMSLMKILKLFETATSTDSTGTILLQLWMKELGHTHATEFRLVEIIKTVVDHSPDQL